MEDTAIIDLYFAREERAISETGRKYGAYCRAIAFNILHSHEDTEECVSDTWLRTWNAIPPTRPNCLRAFLGRITRNLSFTRWEAQTAQKRGGSRTDLLLSELSDCLPGGELPERRFDAQLVTQTIEAYLRAQSRENRLSSSSAGITTAIPSGVCPACSACRRTPSNPACSACAAACGTHF